MPIEIVNAIIWIPFALVVLCTFILTGISGFKKGVWRALMSLGGVILATVSSILISSLLSKLLVSTVSQAVINELPTEDIPPALLDMVVDMIVGCGLSIVLFGILMIVLSIVFHIVSMKIKSDSFKVSGKGLKWAGLGVGLATSIVFALIFLAPAYGTIGTATGMATQLSTPSAQGGAGQLDSTTKEIIDAINKHPLIIASSNGPVSLVNDSVVKLDVGGESLSIPAIMQTFEKIGTKIEMLSMVEDEQQIQSLCADIITILKNDVVHTGWSYSAYQMAVSSAVDYIEENLTEEVEQELGAEIDIDEYLKVLDITKDEFFVNCDALLDFMKYALEHDFVEFIETRDVEILYDNGIIAEAGKLANCSEQAVFVKKLILSALVSDTFGGDFATSTAFVEAMQVGEVTDPEEQIKEAEAILIALGIAEGTPIDVIVRHPQLGEDAALALSTLCEPGTLFGCYELNDLIKSSPEIREALLENLKQNAQLSLVEASENNLAEALEALYCFSVEVYYDGDISATPETTLKALKLLGRENFAAGGFADGGESYDVVKKCLEAAAKIDDCPKDYFSCVRKTNLLIATAGGQSGNSLNYAVADAFGTYFNTESGFDFLTQLSHLGTNPFGVSIDDSAKSQIKETLEVILESGLVSEGDYKDSINYGGNSGSVIIANGGEVVYSSTNGGLGAVKVIGDKSFATDSYYADKEIDSIIVGGSGGFAVKSQGSVEVDNGYQPETYTAEEAEENNHKLRFVVNAIYTLLGI